jgi:hypothetical protein
MFQKQLYLFLCVSISLFACESTTKPNRGQKENAKIAEPKRTNLNSKSQSEQDLATKERKVAEQKRNTISVRTNNSKEAIKAVSTSIRPIVTTEPKKPQLPFKWKNTYSQDKKWMELYESSRTYFLNGWNSEFERNPDASISKEELLLAYRKRMENIFYETPSFIEFCVQEMKISAEFELFCQKWSENVN